MFPNFRMLVDSKYRQQDTSSHRQPRKSKRTRSGHSSGIIACIFPHRFYKQLNRPRHSLYRCDIQTSRGHLSAAANQTRLTQEISSTSKVHGLMNFRCRIGGKSTTNEGTQSTSVQQNKQCRLMNHYTPECFPMSTFLRLTEVNGQLGSIQ